MGAERVAEEQLGLHDALERVGGLADDDRVDVAIGQAGVLEGAVGRLSTEADHGQVGAGLGVLGLADADDCCWLMSHAPASRTATRLC